MIVLFLFLTSFLIACAAYSISLILPNEMVYETVMTAVVLPIFFLSSALFPVDGLKGILKVIINLNPFTHVINCIRTIMLTGEIQGSNVILSLALLAALSAAAFLFAIRGLNRETDL